MCASNDIVRIRVMLRDMGLCIEEEISRRDTINPTISVSDISNVPFIYEI